MTTLYVGADRARMRIVRNLPGIPSSLKFVRVPAGFDTLTLYNDLASVVEDSIFRDRSRGLDTLTVIVDAVPHRAYLENLDPAHEHPDDPSVPFAVATSMLVLTFPDVYWIFLVNGLSRASTASPSLAPFHLCDIRLTHNLLKLPLLLTLRERGLTALLDGAGLRDFIRRAAWRIGSAVPEATPLRTRLAIAIDDEKGFAYFHGYSAYRWGFRAFPVVSQTVMEALFGTSALPVHTGITLTGIAAPCSSLEDLFLNFPEGPLSRREACDIRQAHLSQMADREALFPGLTEIPNRLFISTHAGRSTIPVSYRNPDTGVLESREASILEKPRGGVYGLRPHISLGAHASDYQWPITAAASDSHSAPGRLLLVAQRLLERSKALSRSCPDVMTAITAATCALDAQQLLLNQTPTTSLEALQARHEAEVVGESLFLGVNFHFDVRSRFRDLESEIAAISTRGGSMSRRARRHDACAAIVNAIARRFRELSQFDEEMLSLAEARRQHRNFRFFRAISEPDATFDANRTKWTKGALRIPRMAAAAIWRPIAWVVSRYLHALLDRPGLTLAALIAWPALFALVFRILFDTPPTCGALWQKFLASYSYSFHTFFSLSPPVRVDDIVAITWLAFWLDLEIFAGFVHLGVFLASVYARLARR